MEDLRLAAMGGIFIISLFAVSFPAVSTHSAFCIPKIVFFAAKHFGTGVILSTAFCHLLDDAFDSLKSPEIRQRYPRVGEQTGLIILVSLLLIFLVEYISTCYVDHLHDEPSPLPSPASSPNIQSESQRDAELAIPVESTPLLASQTNGRRPPHILVTTPTREHYLTSILTNSPRYSRSNENFYIINDLKHHLKNGEYHLTEQGRCLCVSVCADDSRGHGKTRQQIESENHDQDGQSKPTVGRRRQVVGILVLQLGIMIHSLVIGLTLALTSGSEFTSLVTAIVFHQMFEGLSLGIRIAALPPSLDNESLTAGSESMLRRLIGCVKRLKNHWLQPTLSFSFAITTPLGIGLGMSIFTQHHVSHTKILLAQGLMSAISAGMLIYAATVEMLGGDFVFGNLGGQGHGHSEGGHGHSHGEEFIGNTGESEDQANAEGVSVRRKILAVGSLLGGVVAMGLIGLGESH